MKTPHQRFRAARTHSSNFGREIIAALKGPKHCRTVTIEHEVGSLPTVTYKCIVKDPRKLIRIGEIMRRYNLIPAPIKSLPLP
jgi:hypothetical protein